ncbi:hypothetical protein [Thalassomonas sp. RHCl1]|uniref:hypothetical protein n=1 Tax=Thalassomonas sp. RHCl1 TaxID=2995320 RepID=UPI00248A9E16|nr:hypothetical protein [Thalassomonas sp. RHCl1]
MKRVVVYNSPALIQATNLFFFIVTLLLLFFGFFEFLAYIGLLLLGFVLFSRALGDTFYFLYGVFIFASVVVPYALGYDVMSYLLGPVFVYREYLHNAILGY